LIHIAGGIGYILSTYLTYLTYLTQDATILADVLPLPAPLVSFG
jgi:hypothetical protein